MFRRPALLIAIVLACVLAIGLLAVGAFPPAVTPEPVERPIPAERFAPRS